jgi:hypothetical protein
MAQKVTHRPLAGGAGAGNVLAWKQRDLKLDLATDQTKSWLSGSAEFVVHAPDLGPRDEAGDAIWLSDNGWWHTIEDRRLGRLFWRRS